MSRALVGALLAGSLLLVRMSLAQGRLREQRLPENVERLFLDAIDVQPPGLQRPPAPELNRAALEKLKDAPWPDVRDLPRVKVTTGGEKPRELRAWLVEETDSSLLLLYDNFNLQPLPQAQIARREAADYAAELQELLARHAAAERNTYVIPFFDRAELQVPLLGDAALVLHAYCALVRGHDAEAKRLLAASLDRHPPALDTIYKSWSLFLRGIVLLENGSPRTQVAAEWRHALAAFPGSVYTEQLREYLTQLDKQVAEDDALAKAPAQDPAALPLAERIAWYIARFPDVRGVQYSQPGHCQTYGLGERTAASDAVIAIGPAAVDALIERLDDRRLTRSIGFWRDFSPHRTVLRVQDVAVQAIDRILDMDFYTANTTSSYFSTEEAATRAQVVAKIKAWWNDNRGKPLVEMYRSRLDEGRAYQRIERLRKIVRLDPRAIDPVATLKRWADGLTTSDKVEYAVELAAHGDLSLLPEIRTRALNAGMLPDYGAIRYLMKHGNASDYRILRATLREERRKGADRGNGNSPLGPIVSGARSAKSPLAVPLLVELLDERGGDQSLAYECFLRLVELTAHDVRDTPPTTRDERHAAIDRWLEWWKREGEAAFLSRHADVQDLTAERKIELSEEALGKLPPLVSVSDASPDVPVSFDVPRQSLAALVREGRVAASEDARGRPAFRFTSPDAALAWFDSAGPAAADDPARAALAPSMRVQIRGLTRPDSRGRVWCSWDRALTPTAVFDQRRWQTYSEPLPPGRIDNLVGFISVFAGASGQMLFQDRNHQFHLFDDAGHVQADSPVQLLEQHADRVRAALPYPQASSNFFYSHFIKDGRGRIWWSNWERDWGALEGRQVIPGAGAIAAVDVSSGYRHELLFPLGDDGRVVVFQSSESGRGVVAEVADGKIRKVADLPIAQVERIQTGDMAVHDRQGRVWISIRDGSRALDTAGKVVAQHRGQVLLADRSGGTWFHVTDAGRTSLARLSPDGNEEVIAVPQLRRFCCLAESPRGVFWAVSGHDLVAIHLAGYKLALGQRIQAPRSDYLWCDPAGRVWLTFGNNTGEAIRLAVSKPQPN